MSTSWRDGISIGLNMYSIDNDGFECVPATGVAVPEGVPLPPHIDACAESSPTEEEERTKEPPRLSDCRLPCLFGTCRPVFAFCTIIRGATKRGCTDLSDIAFDVCFHWNSFPVDIAPCDECQCGRPPTSTRWHKRK